MNTKQVTLPEGYSDKHSGFYVPEELREHYQALTPVSGKEMKGVMERFARTLANTRLSPEVEPRIYWDEVDSILAEADMRGSVHLHYLGKAAERYEKAVQYLERKELQTEQSRCPMCETVTITTPENPLARRSTRLIAPALIEQPGDLHSCLKCYLAVMEAKAALAGAEKVGKSTRKQLAERYLNA